MSAIPTLPVRPVDAAPLPTADILALVATLEPVTLTDLDAVRLLDRVDTKYVLDEQQLLQILTAVGDQYQVLAATPSRTNRYRTLYFDTVDLQMYRDHHNDRHPRVKVRCREYSDSGIYFMEIKRKNNRRRTVKFRMETPAFVERLDDPRFDGQVLDFVQTYSPVPPAQLTACLLNRFQRITLMSKTEPERLTIDIGYEHTWGGRAGTLPGLVIAEVKQPKFSVSSPFVQQLRSQGIRPTGFSKYCTAIIDLYPHVKYNRFKLRFLKLHRLYRRQASRADLLATGVRSRP